MTKNFFVRTAAAGIAALVLRSTTGEIQGFEVDLVREMAKVMKKDLKLETMGSMPSFRLFSRERSTPALPASPSRRNVPSVFSSPFRFINPD